MIKLLCIGALLLVPMALMGQGSGSPFMRGVDISTAQQIENAGGIFRLNGVARDVLDIFQANGANYVRLRLWHTPAGGYCGLDSTLAYAQKVKARGFKFLLDFHYSDTWADPGHQTKPAAWAGLSYSTLKDSVYAYTRDVIAALKNQNTLPDMVQIGNEITAGMLWPEGKVPGTNPTQAWFQFGELVKQGIRGARDGAADSLLPMMIHIDRGADNAGARWFFDNLAAQGVSFDVIGLSYYSWLHGTMSQLQANLNDLSVRYQKPLVVVETAHPWTTQYVNDGVSNFGVDASKLPPGYSITPQGQKAFLFALTRILKATTGGRGAGFFYWEPAYISVPTVGSSWEHLSTFDFNGAALTSITAFMNLDSMPTVNVRLRFNTATNADTLKPNGVMQVRGEVDGIGSSLLPSGELLTWDSYSQVVPVNVGGDYWECRLALYPSDVLNFKMWTGHNSATPTYLRLGWEGPITPFDSSGVNGRLYPAGPRDTTLEVQFYNSTGAYVNQYWSPVQPRGDSIGVLFRVNVANLMSAGLFDPASAGPVVVRGDSASSGGVLSWSGDRVTLQREPISVANGSFWSGVAFFPRSGVLPGTQITYKFYVENSVFGGSESAIADRVFTLPAYDTTLAWRFFNERLALTGVTANPVPAAGELQLSQNYPNPFNPVTTMRYFLPRRSNITMTVYNLLGQVLRVLAAGPQDRGDHTVVWDGNDEGGRPAVSGVYFVRLEAEGLSKTRKVVLLK